MALLPSGTVLPTPRLLRRHTSAALLKGPPALAVLCLKSRNKMESLALNLVIATIGA